MHLLKKKDRFNTEERSVIASSNLKQRETTESEVKKDKPQKRKKSNDSGIQSLDGLNKENEFVDSKKMKKEPGLRKQKNIITRKNEVLSTAVILVRPTDNKLVKESEEETDKNVTIPVSPSSEGLFSSPPHHCHGSQSPITEQKQLSITIERPSTSNMGSNDFKDKMEKVPDIEPKTIVVTPGKDKKKKKHHVKEEKLITQLDQLQSDLDDIKKEQQVQSKMLKILLNNWNEHKATPSNLGSIQLEKKTGFPQVGFTRVSDNSIHLGQGIFVPKNSYLVAKIKAKSASQFVRQMMMAVFTPEELQNSSVHGAKSNKVKQEEQKPRLDPTRLQAVKDITLHYLEDSGISKQRCDAEMKLFYSYVSSKITDSRAEIKRLPKKTGESGVITSNIEKNTVVSDSEESSEDSDDEEINQESEKDGENKQDTKKDESRSKNSKLIDETDENLDADLTQIIDPGVVHEQNVGSIEEDGHKVYDSTNTEG